MYHLFTKYLVISTVPYHCKEQVPVGIENIQAKSCHTARPAYDMLRETIYFKLKQRSLRWFRLYYTNRNEWQLLFKAFEMIVSKQNIRCQFQTHLKAWYLYSWNFAFIQNHFKNSVFLLLCYLILHSIHKKKQCICYHTHIETVVLF